MSAAARIPTAKIMGVAVTALPITVKWATFRIVTKRKTEPGVLRNME